MKLDLKVGQYVRTDKGTIDKLDDNNIMMYQVSLMGFGEKPIKASDKLIDLIKKDDIVKVRIDNIFINYFIVDTFEDDEENEILGIVCYEDGMLDTISEYRPLNTLEILEVLTKEQFEQASYKFEE